MPKWPKIELGAGLDAGLTSAMFHALFSERGYSHCLSDHWPTTEKTLREMPGITLRDLSHDSDQALAEHGEGEDAALVRGGLWGGTFRASIAAHSRDACLAALAGLRDRFPASAGESNEVPVSFWTYSPHGPRQYVRNVSVSPWEEISANYTAPVRDQLAAAMGSFRPAFGGQLMLWTGDPGTGKTWALRALAWEWRQWSSFHYVVDPDKFFGEHADYLIQVLLEGEMIHDEETQERWRVLVLEDSGELLSADARERVGQGLSRLLNVVDGVIGQGLRVLVLVTSNEEVKRLHPAVSRPGRCAMRVEFRALTDAEAANWLHARDINDSPGIRTLADLYALANGYLAEDSERRVGFAAVA